MKTVIKYAFIFIINVIIFATLFTADQIVNITANAPDLIQEASIKPVLQTMIVLKIIGSAILSTFATWLSNR